MATYLDRILEAHRADAALDDRSLERLAERAMNEPPTRGFRKALAARDEISVIAEIKRRSPSKGPLAPSLDAAELGASYERGGAACLSVLTDAEFFGGSPADLAAARAATALPVLRKDFTVADRDVLDARLMGADCVLLIVAALEQGELRRLYDLATDLDLDVLVEVHDERELERALDVGALMIGVNQRDLVTFDVDRARAERMAPRIPAEVVRVAESGIGGRADAGALAEAGYDALLVGETLVRSADPAAEVTSLRVERRRART